MKVNWGLVALATVVSLAWSVTSLVHKFLLKHMTPETLVFLTGVVILLFTVPFGLYFHRRIYADLITCGSTKTVWAGVTSVVLLGFFLAYLLYYYLLRKNDTYIVIALTYTSPLFVTLFATLVWKERITWTGWLGMMMIVGGVMLCSI